MDPNSSETVGDPSGVKDVIQTVGIENLPDKILLQVFELFTHKEIITQLSLVCRPWQTLAQDPRLYRKLMFTQTQPSTRMAVRLVKMASQLVSLDLDKRDDAKMIMQRIGIETPRLKVLRLYQHDFTREFLMHLKNCMKLQDLRLHVAHIEDDVLSETCWTFQASLKVLKISNSSDIDPSVVAVSRCHNMTTLHLDDASSISEENLIAIGDMSSLVDLAVYNVQLDTAEGWLRLFRKPILEKLTSLKVRYCPELDDVVATEIMNNAKILKTLHLNIYYNSNFTSLTFDDVKLLTSHLNLDDLLLITGDLIITLENGVFTEEKKARPSFNPNLYKLMI